VPPAKNGDFAFLLHLISSLKSTGKGAIILPHGVLFRGNKEADIRRNLIRRGLIKGIIGLPANLFYGTGIPACIVVIDKESASSRTGIFMIDASKGFVKDGNKNRLRSQDIHKIVDVFNRQADIPRYSRMVPVSEIASGANDYNLNIPRYIDSSEPEDLHDLSAHLSGGIPDRDIEDLGEYWNVFPTLRSALFEESDRAGYSEPRVEAMRIKDSILEHPEYVPFAERVGGIFDDWRDAHHPKLWGLKVDDLPKEVIHTVSEDLLGRFAELPLISRYDVYQRLMDYWAEVMQDDVYLIAADGWVDAAQPRGIIDDKDRKIRETPDLVVKRNRYKMDLLPPRLIVARCFAEEQAAIEALRAMQESAARELEEFVEEHSSSGEGEEGLLADATNEKGMVTKGSVKDRLKAIENDPESEDEREALTRCLALIEVEADAGKAVKEAQAVLDAKVLAQYAKLSEAEIKRLVIEDKWFVSIRSAVESEVDCLSQRLAGRVKELEERYARPLPDLEAEVKEYRAKVEGHLKRMGLVWD
jgi:type I restriction enzyme M protein